MDVSMPEMGGIEALREIVKKTPHPEVIMLTGVEDKEIDQQAIHDGAFDYVAKSSDPATLESSITACFPPEYQKRPWWKTDLLGCRPHFGRRPFPLRIRRWPRRGAGRSRKRVSKHDSETVEAQKHRQTRRRIARSLTNPALQGWPGTVQRPLTDSVVSLSPAPRTPLVVLIVGRYNRRQPVENRGDYVNQLPPIVRVRERDFDVHCFGP